MKLSQEAVFEYNQIHSYDNNAVVIRKKHQTGLETYQAGFLLSPDALFTDWSVSAIEQLSQHDFQRLQQLSPEIIIFVYNKGLTAQLQQLVQPLTQAGIGVEFMALGPACRTFNLLVNEDRQVLLIVTPE